jgi:hypothetical protein
LFEEYKNRLGYFILKKKLIKDFNSTNSFKNFIGNSSNYIIILPLNDSDFNNSFDIVKYFNLHKKNVTLFLPDHKVNTNNIIQNYNCISYNFDDTSKCGLPTKSFGQKIGGYNFDVLIDLERESNLFLVAVTAIVKAKYKVGFKKSEIDNIYNFELINNKINSEISYRNLLNSLKMF